MACEVPGEAAAHEVMVTAGLNSSRFGHRQRVCTNFRAPVPITCESTLIIAVEDPEADFLYDGPPSGRTS